MFRITSSKPNCRSAECLHRQNWFVPWIAGALVGLFVGYSALPHTNAAELPPSVSIHPIFKADGQGLESMQLVGSPSDEKFFVDRKTVVATPYNVLEIGIHKDEPTRARARFDTEARGNMLRDKDVTQLGVVVDSQLRWVTVSSLKGGADFGVKNFSDGQELRTTLILPTHSALLLKIAGNWEERTNAEQLAAEILEAFEGAEIPEELKDNLPASGPEALFHRAVVLRYDAESFSKTLSWLNHHGLLISSMAATAEESPHFAHPSTNDVYPSFTTRQYLDQDQLKWSLLEDLPDAEARPFVRRTRGIEWSATFQRIDAQSNMVYRRVVKTYDHPRGRERTTAREYDHCSFSVDFERDQLTMFHAFPADMEEPLRREVANDRNALMMVVVIPRGIQIDADAKPELALPTSVETPTTMYSGASNLRKKKGKDSDQQPAQVARETAVYSLQFVDATAVAETLRQLLANDKGIGIAAEASSNSVLVSGPNEALQMCEALLLRLDRSVGSDEAEVEETLSPQGLQQLRRDIQRLEKSIQERVADYRHEQNEDAKHNATVRADVRSLVEEAFEKRLEVHRSELRTLEDKLADAQKALDARARLSRQFTSQRVDELLARPAGGATKLPSISPKTIEEQLKKQKLTATLRHVALPDVLGMFADQTNISLVYESEGTGTVTAQFENASIKDALDAVVLCQGQELKVVGNTLVVLPRSPRQAVPQKAPSDSMKVKLTTRGTMRFKDLEAREVLAMLATQWQVNMVCSTEPTSKLTGTYDNVTLDSVLKTVLPAAGYTATFCGDVIAIHKSPPPIPMLGRDLAKPSLFDTVENDVQAQLNLKASIEGAWILERTQGKKPVYLSIQKEQAAFIDEDGQHITCKVVLDTSGKRIQFQQQFQNWIGDIEIREDALAIHLTTGDGRLERKTLEAEMLRWSGIYKRVDAESLPERPQDARP